MVSEADFVKSLELTRVMPTESKTLNIEVSNTNRPGMQFANYWDFFPYERPQLLGKVEMTYLSQLDELTRRERLAKYFNYPLPCIIICRGYPCFDEMLVLAMARKVPIYSTKKETTQFELELIAYLRDVLAPRETRRSPATAAWARARPRWSWSSAGTSWWPTTWWTSAAWRTTG